jgi:hypothetical protein
MNKIKRIEIISLIYSITGYICDIGQPPPYLENPPPYNNCTRW